jgi:hypothetical protein
MPGSVKCPSCNKLVSALVVDTMRWRGYMPRGGKLFATICPLCEAIVGASVLLDPRQDRAVASLRAPKSRRAFDSV